MTAQIKDSVSPFHNILTVTSESTTELQLLWQEVGLTAEEVNDQVGEIQRAIDSLFKGKVETERQKRDKLKDDVRRSLTEVNLLKKELGDSLSNISSDNEPLRLQHLALKNKTQELRKAKEVRINELMRLKTELYQLYALLGDEVSAEFSDVLSDLTESRLQRFQTSIADAKIEKANRQKEMDALLLQCKELMKLMQIKPESHLDIAIHCDGKGLEHLYSQSTILSVKERAEELKKEKTRREEKLKELGKKINDMWVQLKVPEREQKMFFEKVTGVNAASLVACEAEILRLRELQVAKLAEIVESLRVEIVGLWDSLCYPPASREYLKVAMSTPRLDLTETVLDVLQAEKEKLYKKFESMKPLMKYVEMREALLKERDEYDQSLKDPERLLNLGRDTKRLLREEKLQNRLKKDLPKLNALLRSRIPDWEKENGTAFEYHGSAYLEFMENADAEYSKRKEEERLAKKKTRQESLHLQEQAPPSLTRRPSLDKGTPRTPSTPKQRKSIAKASDNARSVPRSNLPKRNVAISPSSSTTSNQRPSEDGDSPGKMSTGSNESAQSSGSLGLEDIPMSITLSH